MNNFYRNAEMIFNNEPETPNRIEQWGRVSECRLCGCTLPDCESDYCDTCWAEEQAYRAETKKLTPELSRLKDVTLYAVFFLLAGYMVLFGSCSTAHAEEINVEKLANAIYLAEGGAKAKKPYGILSVKCNSEKECRRICVNTIKNNIARFKEYGHRQFPDYLSFLASRYAPVGAGNDPKNLNQNWLKNVKHFYNKAGA